MSDDYKAQFAAAVDELWASDLNARIGELNAEIRRWQHESDEVVAEKIEDDLDTIAQLFAEKIRRVDDLVERYIAATGERPDSRQLDRLATWLLKGAEGDGVLTERQMRRRQKETELPFDKELYDDKNHVNNFGNKIKTAYPSMDNRSSHKVQVKLPSDSDDLRKYNSFVKSYYIYPEKREHMSDYLGIGGNHSLAIDITLPDDVLEFERYDYKEIRKSLKEKCGIYLFYDSDGNLLYIGKTGNLKMRLNMHLLGKDSVSSPFYKDIAKVKIYFAKNPYEAEIYETYAINKFKPKYNRSKTYYESDEKIIVEDELYEVNELIRELKDEREQLVETIRNTKSLEECLFEQERLNEVDKNINELLKRKSKLAYRASKLI